MTITVYSSRAGPGQAGLVCKQISGPNSRVNVAHLVEQRTLEVGYFWEVFFVFLNEKLLTLNSLCF